MGILVLELEILFEGLSPNPQSSSGGSLFKE